MVPLLIGVLSMYFIEARKKFRVPTTGFALSEHTVFGFHFSGCRINFNFPLVTVEFGSCYFVCRKIVFLSPDAKCQKERGH
jgi:hypothetical protein